MSENNKDKKNINKVNLFLALIGIFAPAGYLVGYSYYQGLLSAYGVSTDLFPLTTQEIFVATFYSLGGLLVSLSKFLLKIFNLLFLEGNVIWFSLFAFILTVLFYILIKKPKLPKNIFFDVIAKIIGKLFYYLHWKNNDFIKAVGLAGLTSYVLISILYVLMTLSVFWFAFPYASYYKGQDFAKEKRDDFIKNGCKTIKNRIWSNCKKLNASDGSLIYEGILVAQSNSYVAFFTKDGTFIKKFPSEAYISNTYKK